MVATEAVNLIASNRLRNLRALIGRFGGPNRLADSLNYTNASFLVQMAGPHPSRPITERTARKIEAALSLPMMWMDQSPSEQDAEATRALPQAAARRDEADTPVVRVPAELYPTEEDRQRLAQNIGAIVRIAVERCEAAQVRITPESLSRLVSIAVLDAVERGEVRESRIAALVTLLQA